MRTERLAIFLLVLSLAGSACVPRQLRSVADIDPDPLVRIVQERRLLLEKGIAGVLDLDYRNRNRHFGGQAYIVAFPDGRFRLEVPSPMGGTILVMTSDGREVLAYYPQENRAYRSAAGGKSITPHLPFPLPVAPESLPALLMGLPPADGTAGQMRASLLQSGQKILSSRQPGEGMDHVYLFGKSPGEDLLEITSRKGKAVFKVRTQEQAPFLPRRFDLRFPEGRLKGSWDQVALYEGDGSGLSLRLPPSVPVQDLESPP